MKRYLIADVVGMGAGLDVVRPVMPLGSSWVLVAQRGAYCLVKTVVPGATAPAAASISDMDGTGQDVLAGVLTAARQTAIKTWLQNRGFDVSDWASWAITNRRQLFRWLLNKLSIDADVALHGFDVREA